MCQLFIFVLCCHNSITTNWKKYSWCAWESNPGPQDGSCRQNHGAMAATPPIHIISNPSVYPEFLINFLCSFIKPSLTTRRISDFRTVFLTWLNPRSKTCNAFRSWKSPESIFEMWLEDKSRMMRLWRPRKIPLLIQFSSRLLPERFRTWNVSMLS